MTDDPVTDGSSFDESQRSKSSRVVLETEMKKKDLGAMSKRFRAFKRGTVRLCRSKGCKNVVHQTLTIIASSRY